MKNESSFFSFSRFIISEIIARTRGEVFPPLLLLLLLLMSIFGLGKFLDTIILISFLGELGREGNQNFH